MDCSLLPVVQDWAAKELQRLCFAGDPVGLAEYIVMFIEHHIDENGAVTDAAGAAALRDLIRDDMVDFLGVDRARQFSDGFAEHIVVQPPSSSTITSPPKTLNELRDCPPKPGPYSQLEISKNLDSSSPSENHTKKISDSTEPALQGDIPSDALRSPLKVYQNGGHTHDEQRASRRSPDRHVRHVQSNRNSCDLSCGNVVDRSGTHQDFRLNPVTNDRRDSWASSETRQRPPVANSDDGHENRTVYSSGDRVSQSSGNGSRSSRDDHANRKCSYRTRDEVLILPGDTTGSADVVRPHPRSSLQSDREPRGPLKHSRNETYRSLRQDDRLVYHRGNVGPPNLGGSDVGGLRNSPAQYPRVATPGRRESLRRAREEEDDHLQQGYASGLKRRFVETPRRSNVTRLGDISKRGRGSGRERSFRDTRGGLGRSNRPFYTRR